MSAEVRVRAACGGDVDAVFALERGVAEAPHWAKREYVAMAADECGIRRCFFVAEMDGRLVGFAVGKAIGEGADGWGELESVAVKAAVRRLGVGRALCGAVLEWCRGLGVAAVELEVRAASGGAIALYEGLGFGVAGRRRGYYRDPVDDALLMRLELGKCGEMALPSPTGV